MVSCAFPTSCAADFIIFRNKTFVFLFEAPLLTWPYFCGLTKDLVHLKVNLNVAELIALASTSTKALIRPSKELAYLSACLLHDKRFGCVNTLTSWWESSVFLYSYTCADHTRISKVSNYVASVTDSPAEGLLSETKLCIILTSYFYFAPASLLYPTYN